MNTLPTLLENVRETYGAYDARKHDLAKKGQTPEDYADAIINEMSNSELLEAISDAFGATLRGVSGV